MGREMRRETGEGDWRLGMGEKGETGWEMGRETGDETGRETRDGQQRPLNGASSPRLGRAGGFGGVGGRAWDVSAQGMPPQPKTPTAGDVTRQCLESVWP
ncbi:unnamed protein product [Lampetra fluviatilis]